MAESDNPAGGARRKLQIFGWGLIVVALVVGSIIVQQKVRESQSMHSGPWVFELEKQPAWIPSGFRGELAKLDSIPQRVQLRSTTWRADLERELLACSWVCEVNEIERNGPGVSFDVTFARPTVALKRATDYVLLDANGQILDFQPGGRLSSQWGVPVSTPLKELSGALRPGNRVASDEVRELLSLIRELRRDGVFERWGDRIAEVSPTLTQGNHLKWCLYLVNGGKICWGRAPAAVGVDAPPSPLELDEKLANLSATMMRYHSLHGETIDISVALEPVVSR